MFSRGRFRSIYCPLNDIYCPVDSGHGDGAHGIVGFGAPTTKGIALVGATPSVG